MFKKITSFSFLLVLLAGIGLGVLSFGGSAPVQASAIKIVSLTSLSEQANDIYIKEVGLKANTVLPTNYRIKYFYNNNTNKRQAVKIVRELLDDQGKVLETRTGQWTVRTGGRISRVVNQSLSNKLPVGDYTCRIRVYNLITKELLAENSFGLVVE